MSPVAENHTIDLFYLLKENFSINFFCCHKDGDPEKYAQMRYEVLNKTLLTLKYWGGGVVSQYILQSGSLWHSLTSAWEKTAPFPARPK